MNDGSSNGSAISWRFRSLSDIFGTVLLVHKESNGTEAPVGWDPKGAALILILPKLYFPCPDFLLVAETYFTLGGASQLCEPP